MIPSMRPINIFGEAGVLRQIQKREKLLGASVICRSFPDGKIMENPLKIHGISEGGFDVENLLGGWALPLWKMMEFVSWDDDIPNWMEK